MTGYFNPLLEYIEGYAYNNNQKIIPNAKVSIILKADKSIYYQTTTDSSGFFTIYSKDLPFMDYYLKFEDPLTSAKITQTTTQFIRNNNSYLKSEDLDLMKSTKNNQPIVNPATGQLNEIRKGKNNVIPTVSTKKAVNYWSYIIIFFIFLLILTSIATIFYIRKTR